MGNPKKLSRGFDDAWRNKMLQFQTPIFSPMTRGEWVLRFDDILADAKEQGRLRYRDILLFSAGRKNHLRRNAGATFLRRW